MAPARKQEGRIITVHLIDPMNQSVTSKTIRADDATGLYHPELYRLLSGGLEVAFRFKNGDSLLVNGSAGRPSDIDGFEFQPSRRLVFGKGVVVQGTHRFRSARTNVTELVALIRFMPSADLKVRAEKNRILTQLRTE